MEKFTKKLQIRCTGEHDETVTVTATNDRMDVNYPYHMVVYSWFSPRKCRTIELFYEFPLVGAGYAYDVSEEVEAWCDKPESDINDFPYDRLREVFAGTWVEEAFADVLTDVHDETSW